MAHDVELKDATFPFERVPQPIDISLYTPMGHDLEPELKVAIHPRNIHPLNHNNPLAVRPVFQSLAETFNCSSREGFSVIDLSGVTPRDYVLVSLGQDTLNALPTMRIRQEGLQYRERFALTVFAKDVAITNHDANAKTLLSSLDEGNHRKEFEVACGSPSEIFHTFRQIPNLPVFFNEIDPDSLYIDSVCMTSRTSFFSLTHIPGTKLMATLEHCCDVSAHATPNLDVFVNKKPDFEWETEVKGFYGYDPRLETEQGQSELVNILFKNLVGKFRRVSTDISVNTHSKMERAANSIDGFYLSKGPFRHYSSKNSPFVIHCHKNEIPVGLAYAVTQKVKAIDVHETPDRLIALASALPDPEKMLDSGPLLEINQYTRRVLECA